MEYRHHGRDSLCGAVFLFLKSIDFCGFNSKKPMLYVVFSQDAMSLYEQKHWGHIERELRNKISEQCTAHKSAFCAEELEKCMDELSRYSPRLISHDRKIIYQEALGIMLWCDKSDGQTRSTEVLATVMTAIYYAKLLKRDITFAEREISKDEKKMEAVGMEEKERKVREGGLKTAKFQSSWVAKLLNKDYNQKWIDGMWEAALAGAIKEMLVDKLLTPSRRTKTLCQLLGELQSVGVYDGIPADLANLLKDGFNGRGACRGRESSPSVGTLKDYIRKRFDDMPEIGKWVKEYVASHDPKQSAE